VPRRTGTITDRLIVSTTEEGTPEIVIDLKGMGLAR
jgi:hypothetical protein